MNRTPISDLTFARLRKLGDSVQAPRTADLLLHSLDNAMRYATREGLIRADPVTEGPRFHRSADVVHCRERMPADAEELQPLAAYCFRHPQSFGRGFQILIEAMIGIRTGEALALRMDAKQPPDAGLIQGKHLWLHRAKGGCNPWAVIHDDLAAVIEAHHAWHAANHSNNPYWFPHRDSKTRPAETSAMTQQLRRAAKALGTPARTSHGLRAYYVTVRRSQGIPDGQIAAEIGDRTGASIIASTYGEIPPNWQGGAGMSWTVPGKPAPWIAA